MKILIVDKTEQNLLAARMAASQFPENTYVFTNSASQAVNMMTNCDAIVTGLIFAEVPNKNLQAVHTMAYVSNITNDATFKSIVTLYYGGDTGRASARLEQGVQFARYGRVAKTQEGHGSPQLPLGAGIVEIAKCIGMKHCLVSDIHRCASDFTTPTASVDGVILLLPLIKEEIITAEQAITDGHKSLRYMGSDEIQKFGKDKTRPAVWAEAIRRVMGQ